MGTDVLVVGADERRAAPRSSGAVMRFGCEHALATTADLAEPHHLGCQPVAVVIKPSIWMDLVVLAKTALTVPRGRGAR